MALSDKQIRFCEEYLIDLNATQAAVRAGYSKKTANRIGSENLSKPDIQDYIQKKQQELKKKLSVSQEMVVEQFRKLAFSDIRKFYKEDGSLKKIHELDDDSAAALAGVEVDELWEGFGEDRKQVGVTKKIKRWDPNKALESLARHLGMFKDSITLNADEELKALYKTIMKRK